MSWSTLGRGTTSKSPQVSFALAGSLSAAPTCQHLPFSQCTGQASDYCKRRVNNLRENIERVQVSPQRSPISSVAKAVLLRPQPSLRLRSFFCDLVRVSAP